MTYTPRSWADGELVTAEDLNRIEQALTEPRTPTAHTHPVSDVAGLAARLAALEYGSGVRQINSFISPGWTPATDGARIIRHGREVALYVDLYRVGELTGSFGAVIDIPAGFRPMGVGYQSPAKVTSGPTGWWEMSQNNLRIRDLDGTVTDGARIRNTIKWTTLDTPSPTPPGSNV